MSSKSAVKLVVPEGSQSALYQMGRHPDRLEERAEGRRLLPRRAAADAAGFRAALLILAGLMLLALCSPHADARAARAGPTRPPSSRQMFSNNRAVNVLAAARFFLFAARDVWFVVGLPVLSVHGARLDLLAGRDAPGRVGDRLRRRAGGGAALLRRRADGRGASPTAAPRCGWRSALALSRRRSRSPSAAASTRTVAIVVGLGPLRRRLRAELGRPLLPDPRLHRQATRSR